MQCGESNVGPCMPKSTVHIGKFCSVLSMQMKGRANTQSSIVGLKGLNKISCSGIPLDVKAVSPVIRRGQQEE